MTLPKATSKELEEQIEDQLLKLTKIELVLFLLVSYALPMRKALSFINILYMYIVAVGWVTAFLVGAYSPHNNIYKNAWIGVYTILSILYIKYGPRPKKKHHYVGKKNMSG